MLQVESIVLGVSDVPSAVDFWAPALDYIPREPPEEDWATLVPRSGTGVHVSLMRVSSQAPGHQRHHLDLFADDPEAEIARLEGLGAVRVNEWRYPPDANYTVLEDTDRNRFCVVESHG